MNAAQLLFTVVVYGVTLHIIGLDGKTWLTVVDLSAVLEYRSEGGVRNAYSRHRARIAGSSVKARINGVGNLVRLFDEAAIQFFCQYSKRPGAFHLLRWLEEGGMQLKSADFCASELPVPAESSMPKASVLALVPSTPAKVPCEHQERTKAYCRELLKTLLRYADEADAEHLVQVIEAEVAGLLSHRYCQGLNDARYELYRRFWLQGGAV